MDALERLIPLSAGVLQADVYSPAQIEAALGPVFGVDLQLIRDGTYYVVEDAGRLAGAGGWSRRQSFFGSNLGTADDPPRLDPRADAARVRAFFVHPAYARRGIGACLLQACESAIVVEGFGRVELVATLTGEPLYRRFGYRELDRFEIDLRDGLTLPAVRMTKELNLSHG